MSDDFSGHILNPAQAAIVPKASVGTKHGEHIPQQHEGGEKGRQNEKITVGKTFIHNYVYQICTKIWIHSHRFFPFLLYFFSVSLVTMLVAGWI